VKSNEKESRYLLINNVGQVQNPPRRHVMGKDRNQRFRKGVVDVDECGVRNRSS